MGPKDSPSMSLKALVDMRDEVGTVGAGVGAGAGAGGGARKRKASGKPTTALKPLGFESDGLTDKARNAL